MYTHLVFPRFAKIDTNLTLLYCNAIKSEAALTSLTAGPGSGWRVGVGDGREHTVHTHFAGAGLMVYSFYTFNHGKAFERGFHMTINTAKLQALATLKLPSKVTKHL